MKKIISIIVIAVVIVTLAGCGHNTQSSMSVETHHTKNQRSLTRCTFCNGSGLCNICKGSGTTGKNNTFCTSCDGNGSCLWCGGYGNVTSEQQQNNEKVAQNRFQELDSYLKGDDCTRNSFCSYCGGSGRSRTYCTACSGTGINPVYSSTKDSVLHSFAEKSCPSCSGTGFIVCSSCWGNRK